ncbi:MAG: thiamine pyrophosphate-dependent enzyme [Syntrophales bacterium]|jgi:2-oxoglutarate ferredoxin oxidoreductase subunit beta|nr:thiamine pyrophosphate-dependent enzyme [Syntrophales bacterium]
MSAQPYDIAWCPGCGNFGIRIALEEALHELAIPAQQIVLTSGIGQGAKMPQYLETNYFNGLHGRSVPLAVGIKLARPDLTVIAVSGDGCIYGEGGNHFLHTIRKNLDITILITNNQVYGLTKGQSSPTTDLSVKNPLTPDGNPNAPLHPLSLALVMGAPFVARGFAREKDHLKEVIMEAIRFRGTAVVDILQPCVTFNKINTYQWYGDRVYQVKPTTDPLEAIRIAEFWEDRIAIGVLFRDETRPTRTPRNLFTRRTTQKDIETLLKRYHD